MSYLGAAEVLDQARHRVAPANWSVFRAQASYFQHNALFYLFLAFMMIGLVVAVIAGILLSDVSVPVSAYELLLLCPAVLYVAVIVWLIRLASRQLREPRTATTDHVLVVTPEGLVAGWGATTQETLAVAFADLASVSLVVLHGRYACDFYLKLLYTEGVPPKQIDWQIPAQFQALDVIAQTIIEAQMRFKLEHASQSERYGIGE